MSIPYASASSGMKARDEIRNILQRFGCESVGFMDEFDVHSVLLAFVYRGRKVQLRASAQGWANTLLKHEREQGPPKRQRRRTEDEALAQGMIAVNSILRDWVKGQITAIETGILQFDHIFMPYMLAKDGRPVVEHMRVHLPQIENDSSDG